MDDQPMTIREMCEAFDVTPRALRFYESKELLFPTRIGQKRLFTKRDRARLNIILRGKRYGISLEETRQLLDLYDHDGGEIDQLKRAREMAMNRIAAVKSECAALARIIEDLKAEIAIIDRELSSKDAPTPARQSAA